jgi:hypothetical protein
MAPLVNVSARLEYRHSINFNIAAKVRGRGRAALGRYPQIGVRLGNVWFRVDSRPEQK